MGGGMKPFWQWPYNFFPRLGLGPIRSSKRPASKIPSNQTFNWSMAAAAMRLAAHADNEPKRRASRCFRPSALPLAKID